MLLGHHIEWEESAFGCRLAGTPGIQVGELREATSVICKSVCPNTRRPLLGIVGQAPCFGHDQLAQLALCHGETMSETQQ